MNDYGFDYLNYVTNVPGNIGSSSMNSNKMGYGANAMGQMNYMPNQQAKMKMMNQSQILEPYQGFMRGNLFNNLYDGYKNYRPAELNPTNEKEALLYQVLQYKFALNDLDLYLDVYPNDRNAIDLYNKYLNIEKQMCNKYESMYGPLTLDSDYLGTNSWNWKNSPWPWEGV